AERDDDRPAVEEPWARERGSSVDAAAFARRRRFHAMAARKAPPSLDTKQGAMDETLHPAVGARAGENERRIELTYRGLLLGALITLVFTAANVYLGLKVGLTFASSIPAAVISMAVLSAVKDASILENNIVQTVASAAGTLSAIIFVLPGLVIVGWWTGFPFWQTFLICLSGGVLGVLFTIPLRR